jgi:branched-chain amino acid transport system substrate-binding protein
VVGTHIADLGIKRIPKGMGRDMSFRKVTVAIAVWIATLTMPGHAQISNDVVKIGVLDDMSGPYADIQGPGDTVAVKMAVEDFGGLVLGKPIEVVSADLQNKADIGLAIARRWYDNENVDVILGLGNSSVASAWS